MKEEEEEEAGAVDDAHLILGLERDWLRRDGALGKVAEPTMAGKGAKRVKVMAEAAAWDSGVAVHWAASEGIRAASA